jgi:hypothetical protein
MKYQEIFENNRKYLEISGNTKKYQEIPRKTMTYFIIFPFLEILTIFFSHVLAFMPYARICKGPSIKYVTQLGVGICYVPYE